MMPQNLPVVCAICSCASTHTARRAPEFPRPPGAETADGRGASRSRSSRSPEVGAPLSVAIRSLWVVLPFFPQCVTERTRRTYLDRKTKSRTEARAIGVIEMKRMIVSLVAAAALAAPVGWASTAGAKSGPDPDANGDVHSNCHTGSKFRGAGGEDAGPGNPKNTSDDAACAAVPVTPVTPVNPVTPGSSPGASAAAGAQSAPRAGAAGAAGTAAVTPSGAAVPVAAAPRTTG
jgi:hypothetical protein